MTQFLIKGMTQNLEYLVYNCSDWNGCNKVLTWVRQKVMSNTKYDTNLNNYLSIMFSLKHSLKFERESQAGPVRHERNYVELETIQNLLEGRFSTGARRAVCGKRPQKCEFVMSSEKRRLKKRGS